MRKICLMGAALDTGNMGVSALAVSTIKMLWDQDPQTEISLLVSRRSGGEQRINLGSGYCTVKVVNCRLSPKARIEEHIFWIFFLSIACRFIPMKSLRRKIIRHNTWLRAIAEAEFVGSIHGGDSFSDIYGLKRFMLGVLPDMTVLLMGKKLVLLPQTYGPYSSQLSRIIFRYIVRRATRVLSRDRTGVQLVRRSVASAHFPGKVRFCPDVAFTLPAVIPEKINVVPPFDGDMPKGLIGFNINGLLYNGGYTRANMFGLKVDYRDLVQEAAATLLQKTSAHLLLVPHTYGKPGGVESDPDACRAVMCRLKEKHGDRVHMIESFYDQSELKGIISFCDFFIGSRMHSCIAALSQGIPTVGIAYSKKFIGVFESAGIGSFVIDARTCDKQAAVQSLMQLYHARVSTASALRAGAAGLKQAVRNIVRQSFKEEEYPIRQKKGG